MIHEDDIEALIKKVIPDAQIQVKDMTGSGDHFHISVVSSIFKGKMLLDQHRLVQQALQEALEDGRIHAVQIKTQTPDNEAKNKPLRDDLQILE
ncbi:MAG: BolA family transcriptional regulator [Candidatus Omnitrophica bacterium]|nr:BolA family transcriptional regulator [Candidatus Omnitrophota bacterium]